MNRPNKKKDTSWGKVASWYDELVKNDDSYQAQVILPNLMRVLDLKPGERVIDIGCGQGYFARACQAAGAAVVGADISKELITLASKESRGISYHVAPAHELAFAKDASFDTAIVVLALQNIAEMDAALAETARVLTPRGRMILVLNHPAFRVPKHSDWMYEEADKTQYRRVGRYLSGEKVFIDMHPGKKGGIQTISYHRSLQDISKALRKSGFATLRLEEWISHRASEMGPRQKAEDTARKEIPLFLMLETVKL